MTALVPDRPRLSRPAMGSRRSRGRARLSPARRHGLVVVANRIPELPEPGPDGDASVACPGGLAAVLAPLAGTSSVLWVGGGAPEFDGGDDEHSGGTDAETGETGDVAGAPVVRVPLEQRDVDAYYVGFSNTTIWPLYHDAIRPSAFSEEWWAAYVDVNSRFAEQAAASAGPGATVWVHDYHLQLVPRLLRRSRPDVAVGFFLHVPFPAPDLFRRLPWRQWIVDGLLGAHLVGFQDERSAANFAAVCEDFGAEVSVPPGADHDRSRPWARTVAHGGGRTVLGVFPVGVDAAGIEAAARHPSTEALARRIRADLGDPEVVLLGVDRLDYTKGIADRLAAYRELLRAGVVEPGRAVFVQVATPTRSGVPGYREEQERVEHLVGEINGTFGHPGRMPICYLHRTFGMDHIVGLYRAADVMVVTPLRDGMNLVAKEYVASRHDGTGALVLSEFAGAAGQLGAAHLVNPYDPASLAAGMAAAVRSVTGGDEAVAARMKAMRAAVAIQSSAWWSHAFVTALDAVARRATTRRAGARPGRARFARSRA